MPYGIKGWIMAKNNVFKHDTGRKCLTCLIMNDAFDILLFICWMRYFQESASSILTPRNFVPFHCNNFQFELRVSCL